MLAVALAAVVGLAALLVAVLTTGEAPDDGELPADDEVVEPGANIEPGAEIHYSGEPPANWDITGVAAGNDLNVYTAPGTDNPVTATLATDTVELESTGRVAHVDGVLWREIKVPGATSGWVHGRHLTEHGPPEGVEEIGVGLPAPAMTTAREIFIQAQRGDLAALAALALDGGTMFTASFGDEVTTVPELVALWEQIGRDEVLRAMLALVALPDWYETATSDAASEQTSLFVTPRFMHEPMAVNRVVLEQAFGAAEVEASIADGQWLGWRLGIAAEGDWLFFVSGD